MRAHRALLTLIALGLGTSGSSRAGNPAASDPFDLASPDGSYLSWIDVTVAPGSDFYRFANGGWIARHPIPADRSYWGVDSLLEQKNQTFIRDLLESLKAQNPPAGSIERKLEDFYQSGMDEAAVEAAGLEPLAPELARIGALTDRGELLKEIAHLELLGVTAPLQVSPMQDFTDSTQVIAFASQSGLGLPSRDYYLRSESSFRAARAAYEGHIARMLELLGDAPPAARREARTVLALETRLARASMPDAEQRNPDAIYHLLDLGRARALTPNLDWRSLLGELGHPEIESLNIGMPRFFEAVDRELTRTSLEDWKSYLRWQLVDEYAPYLPRAFVEEDFRMSAVLSGAKELQARWLRVLKAEDDALGFGLGQLYVERRFTPQARARAQAMVESIREALRADLATLPWMGPATRAAAQRKLDLMELRVGYPDRWRDYTQLDIERGPYALNVLRANIFEVRRLLAKIGQPLDRSEWYMTPQTVNAYYDPSMNSLNVPAGILQPPYFDPSWPDAVNFGAIGATIGHEMTHAFDDEGARFDAQGNLTDWWSPADLERFRRATHCIAEQYSRYTVSGGLHVQGDLVTGEATADLGGLELAWRAWQSERRATAAFSGAHGEAAGAEAAPASATQARGEPLQGEAKPPYSGDAQLFFIAFAHSWAGLLRPEQAQELVTTDPHPPAPYRTNGTLANSPEFQAAFGLPNSSPMVRRDRCSIW